MKRSAAKILREYGPFPGADRVNGVTYDGKHVWFASGDKLNAFDPESGNTVRSIDVAAHAGTAFDGRHLFQIAEDRIQKIDPKTGRVLATIPAPGGGGDSGLAWAEGTLWVGQYRDRKIHQIDPQTGAILRTIESNRFVTGVTWCDGEPCAGRDRKKPHAGLRTLEQMHEAFAKLVLQATDFTRGRWRRRAVRASGRAHFTVNRMRSVQNVCRIAKRTMECIAEVTFFDVRM